METFFQQMDDALKLPGMGCILFLVLIGWVFFGLVELIDSTYFGICLKLQEIRCRALHDGTQAGNCHCRNCPYCRQCVFFRRLTPFQDICKALSRRWKKDKP